MSCAIDANAKPLPVVLNAARDELLSSWLARELHAPPAASPLQTLGQTSPRLAPPSTKQTPRG